MSDRLAEVGQRIATVRQLDAVVNAMRGIAAARARQSRALLPAACAYAQIAARAIGQAGRLSAAWPAQVATPRGTNRIVILFGAEQGFAGAFPERILDAAAEDSGGADRFIIGSRSLSLATERGWRPVWHARLPSRASTIAQLATTIMEALSDRLVDEEATSVALLFPRWRTGQTIGIVRRGLFPFDPATFALLEAGPAPLVNLPPAQLMAQLAREHVFAQLCEAGLEAFAAENEARMEAMAAASLNIQRRLGGLVAQERVIRQEEITAEVVELAGSALSRRRAREG